MEQANRIGPSRYTYNQSTYRRHQTVETDEGNNILQKSFFLAVQKGSPSEYSASPV
jgi:hypothetical protein